MTRRVGCSGQKHLALCSLAQNGSAVKSNGYVYRLGGLHSMMIKYGLSAGDMLVFRRVICLHSPASHGLFDSKQGVLDLPSRTLTALPVLP